MYLSVCLSVCLNRLTAVIGWCQGVVVVVRMYCYKEEWEREDHSAGSSFETTVCIPWERFVIVRYQTPSVSFALMGSIYRYIAYHVVYGSRWRFDSVFLLEAMNKWYGYIQYTISVCTYVPIVGSHYTCSCCRAVLHKPEHKCDNRLHTRMCN